LKGWPDFAGNVRYRGAFAAFARFLRSFTRQEARLNRPASDAARRARTACWHESSVGRSEVFDDLSDVSIVDRRTIDLDHLGHFGLPEILLEFRAARLGVDVIGRVTGGAIVLHDFEIGPGLEGRVLVGKRVGDRRRAGRAE